MSDFLTNAPVMVLWQFLSDRIGIPYSSDFVAIGRVQDDKLIAVVGYNNFTGTSCHMHMAGEGGRWMNREILREAFRYPFDTLGLTMVLGIVPSGNIRALRIDAKLGFHELLYIPDAHPDGGIHMLQMKRADCRWIGHSDGKEVHTESTRPEAIRRRAGENRRVGLSCGAGTAQVG